MSSYNLFAAYDEIISGFVSTILLLLDIEVYDRVLFDKVKYRFTQVLDLNAFFAVFVCLNIYPRHSVGLIDDVVEVFGDKHGNNKSVEESVNLFL